MKNTPPSTGLSTPVKRRRIGSLRNRVISWFLLPSLIIFALIGSLVYFSYQQITNRLVMYQDQDVIAGKTRQIADSLSQMMNPAFAKALYFENIFSSDPQGVKDSIIQSKELPLVFDAGIVILDQEGVVIDAQPDRPDLVGQNWSTRPYIRNAMQKSMQGFFSDITYDGADNSPVVIVGVRLENQRMMAYSLLACLIKIDKTGASPFSQRIKQLNLGENTYIIDSVGQVIYHPDPNYIGADLSFNPLIQLIINASAAEQAQGGIQSRTAVASYRQLKPMPWYLVREHNSSDLAEMSLPYFQLIVFLLALGLIIPVVISGIGISRIIKIVELLTTASQQISMKYFNTRVPEKSGDEIQLLTENFNRMSTNLHASFEELETALESEKKQVIAIRSVGQVINRAQSIKEVMQAGLDQCMSLTKMDSGAAFRLNQANHTLILMVYNSLPENLASKANGAMFSSDLVEKSNLRRSPVILDVSLMQAGVIKNILKGERYKNVLSLPVQSRGRLFGMVFLGKYDSMNKPDPDLLTTLETIAMQIGLALENAQLYTQVAKTNEPGSPEEKI